MATRISDIPAHRLRALSVDDSQIARYILSCELERLGFRVEVAESAEAALGQLGDPYPDVIFMDHLLPGIDGLETLTQIREHSPDIGVVMISGHGTIETAVKATKLGAFDFVEKPLSLERTLLVLRNALRQRRLERRNRQLLEQLARDTEIIGRSAAADRLREQVSVAGASSAPVTVTVTVCETDSPSAVVAVTVKVSVAVSPPARPWAAVLSRV